MHRPKSAIKTSPPNCGSGVNPPILHIDGREVMRLADFLKPSKNAETTGLRPCYVNGKKALFHKWVQNREMMSCGVVEIPCAIVEYENGSIKTERASSLRFADSAGLFKQFAFDEEREAKT